jgi:hypothetical protein
MKAIEAFTKLGGRVSEREARKVLVLAEPEDDETVLQAPAEGGMALIDVRPMGMEPEPTEPEARISVKRGRAVAVRQGIASPCLTLT